MFDLAVPLYNLQHLFGIYQPTAQVLVLNDTLEDTWQGVGECAALSNSMLQRLQRMLNVSQCG